MSGFGPVTQPPDPLEHDIVEQKQAEIERATRKGQDEEGAARAQPPSRRRWYRLWRRD